MAALRDPKHERFAQGLAAGKLQTVAYRDAGYRGAPTQCAHVVLRNNPQIRQRAAEIIEERRRVEETALQTAIKRTGATRTWVLSRLQEIVERCMQAEPVLDMRGQQVYVHTPNGDLVPAYTFNAAGANKALHLIGTELGMFVSRKEVGKPGEFSDLSDKELDAQIAAHEAILKASRKSTA